MFFRAISESNHVVIYNGARWASFIKPVWFVHIEKYKTNPKKCLKSFSFHLGNHQYYFIFLFIYNKIMLIGDSGVGKTCLLVRFKDDTFLSCNFIATVGIDFKVNSKELSDSYNCFI